MKMRSCLASVVAAAAAVSFVSIASAVDLTWDSNGADAPVGNDGSGSWDLSSNTWYDAVAGTNVVWSNGNSAIFGNPDSIFNANSAQHNIDLASGIVVQDLVIGTGTNGGGYSFSDFGGGSLTINGNVNKTAGGGVISFLMVNGPITLGAGNHTFFIRDTGGDAAEITMNSSITGSGGVTLNNQFYDAWGTLAFTQSNNYAGTTNISKGRLVITDSNGLGSTAAGTTISNLGTLGFGGGGLSPAGDMNIAEPITITRNTYEGGDFGLYGAAIYNAAGNNTLSGPITLNTTDARIRIENNSNLKITTDLVTSGKISISGGGPGSIELTGNNTGVAGGFNIRGGSLTASNHNNIGGPNSTLTFGNEAAAPGGGGYLKIMNDFMTDFSGHTVNFSNFSGGIDVQGTVFNITESLGTEAAPAGQLNKRGPGVLNLSGTNVMNGAQFVDLGTVNIKAGSSTGVGGMRLRNGTLNIETGATYTVRNNQYSSIAIDATENATVNVFGSLIAGDADFNVSDLANSTGTLNIKSGAVVETRGINYISKNNGSVGNINQEGGEFRVLRGGNFALVLGSRRGIGNYTMTGGTLTTAGEFYVGQGNGGTTDRQGEGFFNQSGGTVTANNWFVIGREGAWGHVNLTNGATFIKAGGGNVEVDAGSIANHPDTPSDMTVDNATFDIQTGELRIGTGGGSNGTFTMKNNAVVNLNNWLGLGRDNGKGVFNLEGGTFTKAGANNISVAWQPNSDGRLIQTGGTFNVTAGQTWISEGGVGLFDVSGGTMTVGRLDVGRAGAKTGTLNISGTGSVTATQLVVGNADTVQGTINLSGGSLKADSIAKGGSTGAQAVNFTGGTLNVGSYAMGVALNNSGTGTLAPGSTTAVGATTIDAGGYTQAATAKLDIDLASAVLFDTVVSAGPVSLAGNISLERLASYDPTNLVPHVVLTGSEVTGKFNTVSGLVVSSTKRLAVTYTPTSVVVTAARPGDANLNGTVEFNDLLALAQAYSLSGQSWATGDFDGTGTTTFDDLLLLAQNYGLSGVAVPTDLGDEFASSFQADWARALTMVPEPTSLALLGMAGTALLRRSRSR